MSTKFKKPKYHFEVFIYAKYLNYFVLHLIDSKIYLKKAFIELGVDSIK